jgi:hypothetical protein
VPKLDKEQLKLFGRSEDEICWMVEKNTQIDGKDVYIQQLSPYKMPWDKLPVLEGGDGPRPRDYYDKIETILTFDDAIHGQLSAIIKGKSRAEQIQVFKNWVKLDLTSQELLLNMNRTFILPIMYDLVELIQNAPRSIEKKLYITPYTEVFHKHNDNVAAEETMRNVLAPYLAGIVSSNESGRIIMPIVVRADISAHGHHWYICVLDIDEAAQPTITIVDSIRKSKNYDQLDDIMELYDSPLAVINNELQRINLSGVERNKVNYCEVLQYGDMGCGISASMTAENFDQIKLLTSSYRADDFKARSNVDLNYLEGWIISTSDGNKIELTADQAERIIIELEDPNEVLVTKGIYYLSPEKEEKTALINDKSKRYDVVDEGFRRISLALALFHKQQIIKRIEPDKVKRERHVDNINQLKLNSLFKQQRSKADSFFTESYKQHLEQPKPPGNQMI